jgi:hypothetical protein
MQIKLHLMRTLQDPTTDTTVDDFQQDLEITVASVTTKSDSSL